MLYLARAEIFRARWTDKIHEEWMRNLAQDKPDIMAEKLQRLRTLIDKAVPDCLVTGFEQLAKRGIIPRAVALDDHVVDRLYAVSSNFQNVGRIAATQSNFEFVEG